MILETLIHSVPGASITGNPAIDITGVASDNRHVRRGDLFVAVPGLKVHGREFIASAVAAGAAAVVRDDQGTDPDVAVPTVHVPNARLALALLADTFFGHPSRSLTVIGITGTNGKTSTTLLVEAILAQAGVRVASLGTLGLRVPGLPNADIDLPSLTTPDAASLQRALARLVERGVTHVVMEVSSHALAQFRVDGIAFDVAAFSNLTLDHLDFHSTLPAYQAAKERLFFELLARSPKARTKAVINVDHAIGADLSERLSSQLNVIRVSCDEATASEARVRIASETDQGSTFTFDFDGATTVMRSPLIGHHNVENLALAVAITSALGISRESAQKAIAHHRGAPGRLERVEPASDISVFVDYAHTPDALEHVLGVCRGALDARGAGQLVVVFGCGGDRDRSKRPIMGAIAQAGSDRAIVTSDNPRSEVPDQIIREIVAGMAKSPAPIVESDRAQAIERAILSATPGSIVLVAGKGHETVQIVGTTAHPFDDRVIASAALAKRNTMGGPA